LSISILALTPELEYAFKLELARFEEENNMPYVTSIERLARKEGQELGKELARDEACHALRQEILEK